TKPEIRHGGGLWRSTGVGTVTFSPAWMVSSRSEEKARDRTSRHETGGAETDLVAPPPLQATSRFLVLDLQGK
ncbi:hypothetical protein A2U01_0048379, partial [Trifolium medium]|nr:hypothetical protein [Trifolium medium]